MGDCGCGDFGAHFKLPAPDGNTYVLQIYDSCPDCDTGAGLIVHRMTEEELRGWTAWATPELPWNRWSREYAERFIPILHPAKLRAALVEHVKTAWRRVAKRDRGEDALAELLDEAFSEVFRDAVWSSAKELLDEAKAAAARPADDEAG